MYNIATFKIEAKLYSEYIAKRTFHQISRIVERPTVDSLNRVHKYVRTLIKAIYLDSSPCDQTNPFYDAFMMVLKLAV